MQNVFTCIHTKKLIEYNNGTLNHRKQRYNSSFLKYEWTGKYLTVSRKLSTYQKSKSLFSNMKPHSIDTIKRFHLVTDILSTTRVLFSLAQNNYSSLLSTVYFEVTQKFLRRTYTLCWHQINICSSKSEKISFSWLRSTNLYWYDKKNSRLRYKQYSVYWCSMPETKRYAFAT